MKELLITIIIFYSLTTLLKSQINYLDPQPNSKYVNTNNSLIIGFSEVIETNCINKGFSINVTGSKSGLHPGAIKLTSDGKKIIYKHKNIDLLKSLFILNKDEAPSWFYVK